MEPKKPGQKVAKHEEGAFAKEGGDLRVALSSEQTTTPSEEVIEITTPSATRQNTPKTFPHLPDETLADIFSYVQPVRDPASWACVRTADQIQEAFDCMEAITLTCSRFHDIVYDSSRLRNTYLSKDDRVYGQLYVEKNGKRELVLPGKSNPLFFHLQPDGPHMALLKLVLPLIPKTQHVYFAVTDDVTKMQVQQMTRQYDLCVKGLVCSGGTDFALNGPYPTLEGLGLSNQLAGPTAHFESLRVLHIQHMRFSTPRQVNKFTKMLEAMPILDDIRFKDVIAIPRSSDIANQHRLVRTNIQRMFFERSSGVDILLACIGIPAGVVIEMHDVYGAAILPADDDLRGEFVDYEDAIVTIADGNLRVEIRHGTSTLGARWTYLPGRWEAGLQELLKGAHNLEISSSDEIVPLDIYAFVPELQRLYLTLHDPLSLVNALIPLGNRTELGEQLPPELDQLRVLRFDADFAWDFLPELVGQALEDRERAGLHAFKHSIEVRYLYKRPVPEDVEDVWSKAVEELEEQVERVWDDYKKRVGI